MGDQQGCDNGNFHPKVICLTVTQWVAFLAEGSWLYCLGAVWALPSSFLPMQAMCHRRTIYTVLLPRTLLGNHRKNWEASSSSSSWEYHLLATSTSGTSLLSGFTITRWTIIQASNGTLNAKSRVSLHMTNGWKRTSMKVQGVRKDKQV